MSRHLYDVSQIMNTPIAEQALNDKKLYLSVIEHRRVFIGLRGFDYATLLPQTLNVLPSAEILELWKQDYQAMRESMIYGESPSFDQLIENLRALNAYINTINY